MITISIISLIASVVAVSFSAYVFWVYDRKIKRQLQVLNQYQLEKIKDEKIDKQKAEIRVNLVTRRKGGYHTIKVFNSGKSTAENIRIECKSEDNLVDIQDVSHFPYERLNPQDYTEFSVCNLTFGSRKLKIKTIWNDQIQNDNELVSVITLP